MALLIISVMMLQGCVVFLSTVATVVSLRSSNNFVSTVLVNKDPMSVHDALLVVVESTPEMELVSVQKEMNLINATTCRFTFYDQGNTVRFEVHSPDHFS